MAEQRELCRCGHTEAEHNGRYDDCAARCLCNICSPGTENDCWCGAYRPGPPADFLRVEAGGYEASGLDEFHPDTTHWVDPSLPALVLYRPDWNAP